MAKSPPPAIQEELVRVVTTLHDILKGLDNEPLFTAIIEKSILVGNGEGYRNTVERLYWVAYPDINLMPRGIEIKTLVYNLVQLLGGSHELIESELQPLERKEQDKYYDSLHKIIEQEVSSISHSFQDVTEDVKLTGDMGYE